MNNDTVYPQDVKSLSNLTINCKWIQDITVSGVIECLLSTLLEFIILNHEKLHNL